MVFGWILGHKMVSKVNKKLIENLIVFLVAMQGGRPSPTRYQPAEPGRRGGVGEGIYMYIYNIQMDSKIIYTP